MPYKNTESPNVGAVHENTNAVLFGADTTRLVAVDVEYVATALDDDATEEENPAPNDMR